MRDFLTEQELTQISRRISEIEARTDAEVVTVLAEQSDDYYYIPTLWAALVGVVMPSVLILLPFWFELIDVLMIQFLVFVVLAVALRFRPLLRRLIPRGVRQWRASNLARRQFLENNLHHTEQELGVLIFVSELERYVEILVDRGVAKALPNDVWEAVVDNFAGAVANGDVYEGFDRCLIAVGEVLAEEFPISSEKNELPNHLVLL
ncbi:MAG: TPM domain-containing protein [Pseudomonadales bacterium]